MTDGSLLTEIPFDFYASVLNSIEDPLNIVDRDFRVVWANRVMGKFVQRDNPQEMIGELCYEMFQRREEPCSECPVKVVFNSGERVIMERSGDMPDGKRLWSEVRAYPIFGKKGVVVYAAKILIDITKKKLSVESQKNYIDSLEASIKELTQEKINTLSDQRNQRGNKSLAPREIEILNLIGKGFSNNEIAEILSISPETVKTHVVHILRKLGVKDRTQAAVWAVKNKIV